jgi:1,4-dihydroxy-2-naphthoate octaprenyltransferase
MSRDMTSDESDAIRFNLDEDPDDEDLQRSYWWSLHRPETYAIASLAIAIVTLVSFSPAQEVTQAIFYADRGDNQRTFLMIQAGIRLGVALFAIFGAMLSVRSEDDDSTWSPPLARAAILVAVLSALFSAATLITTAAASAEPDSLNF